MVYLKFLTARSMHLNLLHLPRFSSHSFKQRKHTFADYNSDAKKAEHTTH